MSFKDEEWEDGNLETDQEDITVTASDDPVSQTLGLDIHTSTVDHLQQGPWYGEGLRVELRPMKHITKEGVLRRPFYFQCPPLETFRVDKSQSFNDYDTINAGQFSNGSGRQLTTISFQTLISIAPAPWIVRPAENWNPKHTSQVLDEIMREETPVRMVAWHPGYAGAKNKKGRRPTVEINMPVTIRSTGREERAGEGDARYFDISFTQWRDPIQNRRRRSRFPRRIRLHKKDTLAKIGRAHV